MTANWKKDAELEDDEIRQGIRKKRTVCQDDEKEGWKIKIYGIYEAVE